MTTASLPSAANETIDKINSIANTKHDTITYSKLDIRSAYAIEISSMSQKGGGVEISFNIKEKSGRIAMSDHSCQKYGFWDCEYYDNVLYRLSATTDSGARSDTYLKKIYKFTPNQKFFNDFIADRESPSRSRYSTFAQERWHREAALFRSIAQTGTYPATTGDIDLPLELSGVQSNSLTFYFDFPGDRIRRFDLIEGGRSGEWHFRNIVLPPLSDEEHADQKALMSLINDNKPALQALDYPTLDRTARTISKFSEAQAQIQGIILAKMSSDPALTISDAMTLLSQGVRDNATKQAVIEKIFSIVSDKNTISSYQWFLDQFPSTEKARTALSKMTSVAFSAAAELDTTDAYNDFIIAFPLAAEVKQAGERANTLDKKKFSGWFVSDEKNSRALLIQAKRIEQNMTSLPKDSPDRRGYLLVINRMTKLLQSMYPAEEATLRYFESEEFKSVNADLRQALQAVNDNVSRIADRSSDITRLLQDQSRMIDSHFRNAALSTDMAERHAQEHREWQRYMATR